MTRRRIACCRWRRESRGEFEPLSALAGICHEPSSNPFFGRDHRGVDDHCGFRGDCCAQAAKGARLAPPVARSEDQLIAVLTSKARTVEKNKACRELKLIGTEKSIPALAALLTDKDLHFPARFALESMPYPAAGERCARPSPRSRARPARALMDSLGERRDAAAVAVIAPALADKDRQVVAAAAWAVRKDRDRRRGHGTF